jgi:F-type H+-transporting ATPase subunit gamma
MPSLKSFRLRIRSVQSTQKITKAMKMVAAAKLRRAQEQAMAARPYAEAMDKVLAALGQSFKGTGPKLLAGTGSDKVQLLIVATADRGLCGAFNSSIVREARRVIRAMLADGKTVKVLCIGRKARDQLRRDFGSLIIDTVTDLGRPRLSFGDAQIFRALLENAASFYGSQMTAMDNASRNAGEVIKKLTLQMNRSRQASITKELIEIISGAEAV